MDYKVLDRLAKTFSLSRKRDFAVGEINGFMVSVIKDPSGINEVNVVFKEEGLNKKANLRKDRNEKEALVKLVEGSKGEFNIRKYKVKDNTISLVIAKIIREEDEYDNLKKLIEKLTLSLGQMVGKTDVKAMKEEALKNAELDDFKKPGYKGVLKKIIGNKVFSLSLGVFLIILLWYYNKNTNYINFLIAFLTPFILNGLTRKLSNLDLSLSENLLNSVSLTIFGTYFGTFLRVFQYYREALENPIADAFYNVNRSILVGDNLSGRGTVLAPLIIGLILNIICVLILERRKINIK